MKDGGEVWVKETNERIKREKGTNYFQGTDVNTPQAWCSHDGDMDVHITQTQEGFLQQEDCDSVTVQKSVFLFHWRVDAFQNTQKETGISLIFIDYSVGEGFPPVSTLCPAINERKLW